MWLRISTIKTWVSETSRHIRKKLQGQILVQGSGFFQNSFPWFDLLSFSKIGSQIILLQKCSDFHNPCSLLFESIILEDYVVLCLYIINSIEFHNNLLRMTPCTYFDWWIQKSLRSWLCILDPLYLSFLLSLSSPSSLHYHLS